MGANFLLGGGKFGIEGGVGNCPFVPPLGTSQLIIYSVLIEKTTNFAKMLIKTSLYIASGDEKGRLRIWDTVQVL